MSRTANSRRLVVMTRKKWQPIPLMPALSRMAGERRNCESASNTGSAPTVEIRATGDHRVRTPRGSALTASIAFVAGELEQSIAVTPSHTGNDGSSPAT